MRQPSRDTSFILKILPAAFVTAFALSLIPLIWVSVFNRPCADDYSYCYLTHMAFTDSKGILGIILGAFRTSADYYLSWQGTFTAAFVMSLHPAIFNESLYFITTLTMLFMLIAPTLFLLQTIVVRALCQSSVYVVLLGIPVLFFSTQYLPSPVQGLFWFNGSVFYTFYYGIMLFLLAMCIRLLLTDPLAGGRAKASFGIKLFLCAFSCFMISGGNYVTALITPVIIFFALVFCFITRKPFYIKLSFALFLIILLAGLGISLAAPGNAVRQAALVRSSVPDTIRMSFETAFRNIISWTDLRLVSALLFLMPVFYNAAKNVDFRFRYPLLAPLVSYCVFSAQYAPSYYAMSTDGDGRLHNIVYYFFILLVFLNALYIVGWLGVRLRKHKSPNVPPALRTAGLCAACAVFIVSAFLGFWETTAYICARDIANGTAKQYAYETDERLALLKDGNVRTVGFAPFTVMPEALYFDDITTDTADWRNVAMALYYRKESVVLLEPYPEQQ